MEIGLVTYPIERSPAGVGTYTYNLVKHILAADTQNKYYLLHYQKSDDPIYSQNEIVYRHFKNLPIMFSDSWYLSRSSQNFDLIHRHAPGGFLFNINSKKIITVYDLFMYKTYSFNRKLKVYLARFFNKKSILEADAVITISKFSKQEIVNTFNIREDKVHVIYSGPGCVNPVPHNGEEILRNTYQLANNYILFVSTIEPRKNLLNLVKTFEILKDRYHIDEDLVVIGRNGWDYQNTLNYIDASPWRRKIHLLGFVPDSDLGCFYRNASLFVYPSFMEGFGIPPLEAMTYGCPTLTTNTSSLPEVMQFPEMMFDPYNVEEIVDKCQRILTDPIARKDNIQKARVNTRRFSWQKSAEKMIAIYDQLAG
jgi:glycosyltransferase involved in cell wall biosynthesis